MYCNVLGKTLWWFDKFVNILKKIDVFDIENSVKSFHRAKKIAAQDFAP